jgi:hypothetical protein
MQTLDSAKTALDLVLMAAAQPLEHQTIVLLGRPDEGGGSCVVIDGEVPRDELSSMISLLAGVVPEGSPLVVATLTPEPPTLTEDELSHWFDLDEAVAAHGATLCEWFLVGEGTAIAVGEWSGVEPRWPVSGSRASAKSRRRASPRAFRPRH